MSKRALCVGINNFKNYPDNSLNGCINDAYDMRDLLVKYMGFKDKEIFKILDKDATKVNIMKNLKEMVEGAKKGKYDSLVFSMSSHGTQQPDTSGDETDRMDEAFCPYDLKSSASSWDMDHIITDDELHDLFIELPEKVNLEVFLDTCHSGTGLKAIEPLPDQQPRYIPPPTLENIPSSDKSLTKGSSPLEEAGDKHILWAACQADQTSADAHISGEWHGAFTYYLCQAINQCENKKSREKIINMVVKDLKENKYDQIPQLEGEATIRKNKIG